MSELRYDPLLDDWVIIADKRQKRPDTNSSLCAFCPGSGKVPEGGYGILRYPNDFPSMSTNAFAPLEMSVNSVHKAKAAYGRCEVILYSDKHDAKLRELSDEKMLELAKVWKSIYEEYCLDEAIKYTFFFENRGKEVGVTMIHPHGQVYGYGFNPLKISRITNSLDSYQEKNGACLICDVLKEEKKDARRILFSDKYFSVYVPYASRYPYGVNVVANEHIASLDEMDEGMLLSLGKTIKNVSGMYDNLFDMDFPYMMCMFNAPPRPKKIRDMWHFYIEYFPPLRSQDSQKYNASSETGCWAHCNPTLPEQKAAELKSAYEKYLHTVKIKP